MDRSPPSRESPEQSESLFGPGVPKLVSCIVPAYNAERWLSEALGSVLDQTYRPVEAIVVDDGSTDRTFDIVASFGDRVVGLRQLNAGPALALNHGIRASRGEFLAFLDADDLWPSGKLELQVARLREAPELAACYGLVQNFWVDGLKIEEESLRGHRILEPIPGLVTGTLLARRSTFARVGLFEDRRHAYALAWAMRLRDRDLPHEVIDEVLLRRRYHEGNMSRDGGPGSREQVLDLLKRSLDARRGG
jgi:glycosyltransferase involved in cell wall biosynthesis